MPKIAFLNPADPGTVSHERATDALRRMRLLLKSTHLNKQASGWKIKAVWASQGRLFVIVAKC